MTASRRRQLVAGKVARVRTALTAEEWMSMGGIAAVLLALNVLGWLLFVFVVLPQHFHYGGRYGGLGTGFGVAITAYTLGMRHAFDADHISAIDNVTRKLMAENKRRPMGTGFFFSLGHSLIVFIVAVGISVAAKAVFGAVVDPNSAGDRIGGIIGTGVSGVFLYIIAAMNVVILVGIVKVFARVRRGVYTSEELEAHIQASGMMYRFFGRFMRSIRHSWQMFFVGLVFGIGFDTATEVLLLAATAAAAMQGLPWYAVLTLPLLFGAGMTIFDSLDGVFMNVAYGWAFAQPLRKVYYNIAITGLSVAIAFFIGTIELFGLLAIELHLHDWFWNFMAGFNINEAGYVIVVMFVVVWAAALSIWHFGKIESRWADQIGDRETLEG
jgi:high-affinity nickel-transport protein